MRSWNSFTFGIKNATVPIIFNFMIAAIQCGLNVAIICGIPIYMTPEKLSEKISTATDAPIDLACYEAKRYLGNSPVVCES